MGSMVQLELSFGPSLAYLADVLHERTIEGLAAHK